MSGGTFDYSQHHINQIASDIEQYIAVNDCKELDRYDDPIGHNYPPEIIEKFKEAVIALQRAAIMAQRIDYLIAGDDGEQSFLKRWDQELTEHGNRN